MVSFIADWMTEYHWMLAVPDKAEPEKFGCGTLSNLSLTSISDTAWKQSTLPVC